MIVEFDVIGENVDAINAEIESVMTRLAPGCEWQTWGVAVSPHTRTATGRIVMWTASIRGHVQAVKP